MGTANCTILFGRELLSLFSIEAPRIFTKNLLYYSIHQLRAWEGIFCYSDASWNIPSNPLPTHLRSLVGKLSLAEIYKPKWRQWPPGDSNPHADQICVFVLGFFTCHRMIYCWIYDPGSPKYTIREHPFLFVSSPRPSSWSVRNVRYDKCTFGFPEKTGVISGRMFEPSLSLIQSYLMVLNAWHTKIDLSLNREFTINRSSTIYERANTNRLPMLYWENIETKNFRHNIG